MIQHSRAERPGRDGRPGESAHIRPESHLRAGQARGTVPRASAPGASVRPFVRDDWATVREIYEQGISTGHATFETEPPAWVAWDRAHSLRIVAELDGTVAGWASLSPVSERCVYAGVAEDSVYVATSAQGRGIGRMLLDELIRRAEADGIWTLQAGIFPENEASIALHERCGFRAVGTRERIGRHQGVWRDVVLMERRSEVVS